MKGNRLRHCHVLLVNNRKKSICCTSTTNKLTLRTHKLLFKLYYSDINTCNTCNT